MSDATCYGLKTAIQLHVLRHDVRRSAAIDLPPEAKHKAKEAPECFLEPMEDQELPNCKYVITWRLNGEISGIPFDMELTSENIKRSTLSEIMDRASELSAVFPQWTPGYYCRVSAQLSTKVNFEKMFQSRLKED